MSAIQSKNDFVPAQFAQRGKNDSMTAMLKKLADALKESDP